MGGMKRFLSAPLSDWHTHRHSVAVIAALSGLAGGMLYLHLDVRILGAPFWLAAGLIYAGAIGLVAAALQRLAPSLVALMTFTALSRLALAVTVVGRPDLSMTLTSSPILMATLVVAGAAMLHWVDREGWQALPRIARPLGRGA